MTTVLDIIDKGTSYLDKRGIADARRNMQWLVAHQLGCTRMDLYLRFDEPLDETFLAPLREALKRRGDNVPLQYLLGTVPFRQHQFLCDTRALIPRPETDELAEWLATHLTLPENARILDVGTGSGCLALSLAHDFPHAHVTLSDLSTSALDLARENAARLTPTVSAERLRFVESDLFSSLPANESFDLIVANLPYVPDQEPLAPELRHEPPLALFGGPDGLDVIRRFIAAAPAFLKPGAHLALEIGSGQAPTVEALLRAVGLGEINTLPDLSGVPRFPIARQAL